MATVAQVDWNNGQTIARDMGVAPKPGTHRRPKAPTAAQRQQATTDAARLLDLRWQVRYLASRHGPDRDAARDLLWILTAARTIQGARDRLAGGSLADGRLALLDQLTAEAGVD